MSHIKTLSQLPDKIDPPGGTGKHLEEGGKLCWRRPIPEKNPDEETGGGKLCWWAWEVQSWISESRKERSALNPKVICWAIEETYIVAYGIYLSFGSPAKSSLLGGKSKWPRVLALIIRANKKYSRFWKHCKNLNLSRRSARSKLHLPSWNFWNLTARTQVVRVRVIVLLSRVFRRCWRLLLNRVFCSFHRTEQIKQSWRRSTTDVACCKGNFWGLVSIHRQQINSCLRYVGRVRSSLLCSVYMQGGCNSFRRFNELNPRKLDFFFPRPNSKPLTLDSTLTGFRPRVQFNSPVARERMGCWVDRCFFRGTKFKMIEWIESMLDHYICIYRVRTRSMRHASDWSQPMIEADRGGEKGASGRTYW